MIGPFEHDQGLRARRVAAVFDAIDRIGHRFGKRNQDRHVLGAAAGHHAVHRDRPDRHGATFRQDDAERFLGVAIGEVQELLDLLERRRNDRQPVAPLALIEVGVHFLERAAEHDFARARLRRQWLLGGLRQQIVDDLLNGDVKSVRPNLLNALRAGMTDDLRHREIGHAKPDRRRGGLTEETLADQRRCGKAGSFARFTGPQHGGRATASTRHR